MATNNQRPADTRQAVTITGGSSKALYRVTDAMAMLSLSRTVIYEQIRSNRLRTVKVGKSRRVPATAIADFVTMLEHEAGGKP